MVSNTIFIVIAITIVTIPSVISDRFGNIAKRKPWKYIFCLLYVLHFNEPELRKLLKM